MAEMTSISRSNIVRHRGQVKAKFSKAHRMKSRIAGGKGVSKCVCSSRNLFICKFSFEFLIASLNVLRTVWSLPS